MRILIIFGTTEGHTRELCQFASGVLREAGCLATLEEATPKTNEHAVVAEYDAFLLAGSLHVGRFQPGLTEFARRHHEILNARPSGFIGVSLSAAGYSPEDWEGLEICVRRFLHETLWTPIMIHHAAGAIRYSRYDFFKRLVLQHIARERNMKTSTSRDYDLTDYEALRRFLLEFVDRAQAQAEPQARATSGDAGPTGGSP